MPKVAVVFYREDSETVPVLDWLDRLPAKAQDKCRVRIERLRDLGHELHRPEADYLRDGIYELRVGFRGMNYRMLYLFHGRAAAVLAHGLVKERKVPPRDRGGDPEKVKVRTGPGTAYLQGGLIMPKKKRRPTTDAVEILHRRYYEGKPERLSGLEKARANDQVARKIAALRRHAGLSQRQLAQLVGTTASVICRLEDADYAGHSLVMLNRIAAALNRRVEIRFVPAERRSA